MKKAGKVFLYAIPVVLAGGLYLGEATGMNVVLAKTVKTMVSTQTEVWDRYAYSDTLVTEGYNLNGNILRNVTEVAVTTQGQLKYKYDSYKIATTEVEAEIEVPDEWETGSATMTEAPYETATGSATMTVAPETETTVAKVTPTLSPEEAAAQDKARQDEAERKQEQARYEAAWEVQKASEKKVEDFYKAIAKSIQEANSQLNQSAQVPTAVIRTDYYTCFTKKMMQLLADNSHLNYEIHFRYQGKGYVVTIPAGYDYSQLKDTNGYYGFRYLQSIFGGYEESIK